MLTSKNLLHECDQELTRLLLKLLQLWICSLMMYIERSVIPLMKRRRIQRHICRAFSLQEMLVVIAIIGITTLIVLPAVSNLTAKAEDAADRRNAQHLTSVAAAATATGDPAFKSLILPPRCLPAPPVSGTLA